MRFQLATLADCLTMASAFEGPLRTFPVIQGLATLSRTEVRRPPRPHPARPHPPLLPPPQPPSSRRRARSTLA